MIRINLIRDRAVPAASPRRWLRSSLVASLAGVVLVAGHVVQRATLVSLRETRDRLLIEVAARQASRKAQAPAPAPSPSTGAALTARRLRHLAVAVPAELWVVSYRERQNDITIEGIASGDDAVQQLASTLKGNEGFGDVEITETARRDKSDLARYAFTLAAGLPRTQATRVAGTDAGAGK